MAIQSKFNVHSTLEFFIFDRKNPDEKMEVNQQEAFLRLLNGEQIIIKQFNVETIICTMRTAKEFFGR